MHTYLSNVWKYRFFWMSLVRMDLRTRYRRSVLGIGWSLLHPIAMTAILCAVFARIFEENVTDFAPYLLAGLCCWTFLTTVTLVGANAFFVNEAYIRQCPQPMAIYPLRTALGCAFHFLMAQAAVLALILTLNLLGYPRPFNPLLIAVIVPTATVMLFVLGWSLATLVGLANVHFADTHHIAEIGFQILFYCSPIMYRTARLRGVGLSWLADLNPVVPILQVVRDPLLTGELPSISTFLTASGIVAAAAGLAVIALSRLQKRLIFHL